MIRDDHGGAASLQVVYGVGPACNSAVRIVHSPAPPPSSPLALGCCMAGRVASHGHCAALPHSRQRLAQQACVCQADDAHPHPTPALAPLAPGPALRLVLTWGTWRGPRYHSSVSTGTCPVARSGTAPRRVDTRTMACVAAKGRGRGGREWRWVRTWCSWLAAWRLCHVVQA